MNRLFDELTPECDFTAQLFARGYEKKEIAEMKCRSYHTINAQIHTAFEALKVRNGRELTVRYAEKLTGQTIFKVSERARRIISLCILAVFFLGMADNHRDFRRIRRAEVRTEKIVRREI